MTDSERPSPFTVFPHLSPDWTPPDTREKQTVGQLIGLLVEFADCYEANQKRLASVVDPYLWPHQAAMNATVTGDYQRRFRSIEGIDRVRSYVLANYGADLTIGTARRLLGDLIKVCGLTVDAAEALPLEAAMDQLQAATSQNVQVISDFNGATAEAEKPVAPNRDRKRSTKHSGVKAVLIAALTKHHQYANSGCLNLEPIGNNELAKLAGVSAATASAFFKKEFKGHGKYKALCCDAAKLTAALKLLNDEFAPYHLLGETSSDLAASEQDGADLE